jgi:hypothetical protein
MRPLCSPWLADQGQDVAEYAGFFNKNTHVLPVVQVIQPTIYVNNSAAPGFRCRLLRRFARRRKRNDRLRMI